MRLDEYIIKIAALRSKAGNVEVLRPDFFSGVLNAVVEAPAPRIATLAKLSGRERKRRLHNSMNQKSEPEAQVVLG